jgi:hypothetical protein
LTHATKIGIACQHLTVVPFSEQQDYIKSFRNQIPYGSTKLIHLSKNEGFAGLFFNEETANHETCVKECGTDMLNYGAMIYTIKDVMDYNIIKSAYYYTPVFIRPFDDLKAFAGTVIRGCDFEEWYDNASNGGYTISLDQKIIISSLQTIDAEFRFFIAGGQVIDGSMYRRGESFRKEHISLDSEAGFWAKLFANKWLPAEVVCMDIAQTRYSGMKIIEFNCFNCSGIYDHDVDKIVREVSRFVNGKI